MSQQDFGNQEWEIEKILGNKCVSGPSGKYKFLVKWMGWSDEYNEWIHEDALSYAKDIIEEY